MAGRVSGCWSSALEKRLRAGPAHTLRESALELLRVRRSVVQYRHADVVARAELEWLQWLREHRGELVRALGPPSSHDVAAFPRWLRHRFGSEYASAANVR